MAGPPPSKERAALERELERLRLGARRTKHERKAGFDTKMMIATHILTSPELVAIDETGREWVFKRSQAISLIANKTITLDPVTKVCRILAKDAEAGVFDQRIAICDFCGAGNVLWMASAENFEFSFRHEHTVSHGSWAACDPCGMDIARGDRRALFLRAVPRITKGFPAKAVPRAKREIAEMHELFWRHFLSIQLIETEE